MLQEHGGVGSDGFGSSSHRISALWNFLCFWSTFARKWMMKILLLIAHRSIAPFAPMFGVCFFTCFDFFTFWLAVAEVFSLKRVSKADTFFQSSADSSVERLAKFFEVSSGRLPGAATPPSPPGRKAMQRHQWWNPRGLDSDHESYSSYSVAKFFAGLLSCHQISMLKFFCAGVSYLSF